MPLISLTAYAETHGVTKQSAAEWKAKGYLVMQGALVDQEASDARMEAGAKGRFRVKAHGGRRAAGVRGAIDRPGMGYVGGKAVPAREITTPARPWVDWHPLDNPNTLCTDLKKALDAKDPEEIEESLDCIQFSQWEDASTAAGWDRWPSDIAEQLAAELGDLDSARVEAALHRHVVERLTSLGWSPEDLADQRLEPR